MITPPGTGLTVTLYPDPTQQKVLSPNLDNKGSSHTSSYSHNYPSPLSYPSSLSSITPRLCVSNSLGDECVELSSPVTIVEPVGRPVIDLQKFVKRGEVVLVEAGVEVQNYFWTKNTQKMEMKLTETGFAFEDDSIDNNLNNEKTLNVYFDEIGEVTLGLYVYNLLSWLYTEKTVFVELILGNVPVDLNPPKYIKTGVNVSITLNCLPSITHRVLINTTNEEASFQCSEQPLNHLTHFNTSGIYSILITTFNNISSSEKPYTIVVQDEVDIEFSVHTVDLTPPSAVAVDSVVSFIATSTLPFVPQSDLSVTWKIDSSGIKTEELVSKDPVSQISTFSYKFTKVCMLPKLEFKANSNISMFSLFFMIWL